MSKTLQHSFLITVAVFLLLTASAMAGETLNGNLVTANWLEKHLHDAGVLILDASPTPAYAAQHIPGAVSVDVMTYGVQDMPVADTERRFQSWGISPAKKVVFYDQGGSMLATRLFFALLYYGFPAKNLFVLDGGLAKWQAEKLPVTKDATPPPKPGTFRIKKTDESVRVRLPEFLTASGDTVNNALVEALGANWHFGEVVAFNKAGHIPNSVLLPSADFYNADKTFKSPDEIRKMAAYVGVRPEQQIYTYCGGGVAASVPFFALKFLLGYPNVKLFQESEMGWLADQRELPYWTYDAPFLMRDTKWLQFWGGEKIRTFVDTKVSMVDVRPATAFNQGHIRFALNIPAEVFKNNVSSLDKLAEVLGPSGLDASHEAVVISGGAITPDSALAFAMLEKLGQKKVSVFTDSIEKWTQLGFAVTTDATVVAAKKGPHDLSIPPTTYPRAFRNDVLISDAKSTNGIYPKVFIASGKNAPENAKDGKVVHVPYTDLLNADGTPKAAKEIWSILSKAGVPRYGELVCFSDDPAEAAANYFILRLMGYPDVKVLVPNA